MREIKFRAWDKKENRFLGEDEFVIDNNGRVYRWLNDNTLGLIEHSMELLQSTGLFDKQCVEIYEGDILKWEIHLMYGKNAVCFYDACFRLKSYFAEDNALYERFCARNCEVIGNIYEHSHLLESEK